MARLISTEAEYNAWDSEIEPDVDIKVEVLKSLHDKRYLDDFDYGIMLMRFGV